jgi:protein-S-isoprenylcysteine O-methyltransferase Ste14
MIGALVVFAVMLSYVAMQGAIVFVTAYLLRKSVRKKINLSKRKAVIFSYFFWAFVMAGSVVLASDMGSLDVWGGVLVASLTGLASAALYLWLWQRHDRSCTRNCVR